MSFFRIFYFVFVAICVTGGNVYSESNSSNGLTPFEKADLRRLLELDVSSLSQIPIKGVLGFEQEYWRNPASVHVIRPEDITLNGYLNSVEALRGVPGMHVSRGLAMIILLRCGISAGFRLKSFWVRLAEERFLN
jgi:hypothetical protein